MVLPNTRYRAQKKWASFNVVDDFNRANTTSSTGLGDDWWHFSSYRNAEYPRISSNQARGSGSQSDSNLGNGAVRKEAATAPNYWVQATATILPSARPANVPQVGLIVRANETADHTGQINRGPEAIFCAMASDLWHVYRKPTGSNGDSPPTVLAQGTGSYTAGGIMRVEVVGNLLTFKYAGATLASSVNIAGLGSGQQVGIMTNSDAGSLDDFAAGAL